jgi:hypothetical protein
MTLECTFCGHEVREFVVDIPICNECLGKLMKFVIRLSDFLARNAKP